MKKTIILLIFCLLPRQAVLADDTLFFYGKIKNEFLAEEAIQLLHCLSERTDSNWEISLENSPKEHSLYLEESSNLLVTGAYYHRGVFKDIRLIPGSSLKICQELFPTQQNTFSVLDQLPTENMGKQKTNSIYLWISGGVAAAIVGFLYWKHSQPDHQSIIMQ